MLTYNYVNLNDYFKHSAGFLIDKGWGQAVQGGLSCPPPRISERMDNQQELYLFQLNISEVDDVIKISDYFSQSEMLTSNVELSYVLTRGGVQAVQGGLSCPPHPKFQRERIIRKFYYTNCYRHI